MSDQKKNTQPPVDTALLILVLVLAVFGLIILLSASEYNGRVRFHDSAYYFKKQLFATSLGLGAMYIISTMNYRFLSGLRLLPICSPCFSLPQCCLSDRRSTVQNAG